MDLVNNSTGQTEQVPEAQAAQAFLSGSHGVQAGQVIHGKDENGEIGRVAPEHLADFLKSGGQLASPEEARAHDLEQKYGGVGGTLAAGAEGAARGISVGLSDPLAVGATRMFAGDKAAEHVRQHLAEEKEAHPYVAGAGEVLGAAAPLLLSGGGTAALEGAEAASQGARMLGSVGEGVRMLGAAPRGIDALGMGAERLLGSALGDEATTVLGRAAQAAAKTAGRAMVEGGLWSAGSSVSDATLQDHEITAEKLLSAVGHGALVAGLLGGSLGGAGKLLSEGASALLGRVGGDVAEASSEQAYKSLNPTATEARIAARHGGPAAVGKTFMDEVIRPAVEADGLTAAAMGPGEKLEATHKAMDRIGKKLQAVLESTPAKVKASEILAPFEAAAAEAGKSGKAMAEGVIPRLSKVRESFAGALGVDLSQPLEGQEVSVADLVSQRRELQKMAKFQLANPSEPIEHFRSISGAWNELEEKALNAAGKGLGDTPAGAEFRGLNRTYSQLADAERSLSRQATSEITKPSIGLKDIIMGGGLHAPAALLAGHPVTALAAVGGSYAHHMVAEHANTYAALMLDRLASMGGVSAAARDVDAAVDRGIDGFINASARKVAKSHGVQAARSYEQEEAKARQLSAMTPAAVAAHVDAQTGGLSTHLPGVSQAMQAKVAAANALLASKLPQQDPSAGASLTPQLNTPKASAPQKAELLRTAAAVDGGVEGVAKRLGNGSITAEDVEYLKKVAPKTFAEIQQKILTKSADRSKPYSYEQRKKLGLLFDVPTDPTMTPDFIASFQDPFKKGQSPAPPTAGGAPKHGKSPPAKLQSIESMVGPIERAQGAGGH